MASQQVEDRIRILKDHFENGRYSKAEYFLHVLANEKLSPAQRVTCAEIARRSGFQTFALKLLQKRIYPSVRRRTNQAGATPLEYAEYAASLAILGGHNEAKKIFSGIDGTQFPQIRFHQAVAALGIWDYETARTALESFLRSKPTGEDKVAADLRLAMVDMRHTNKNPERAIELLKPYLPGNASTNISRPNQMYAAQMEVEHTYLFKKDTLLTLKKAEALEAVAPDHNSAGLVLWITLLSIYHGKNTQTQKDRLQIELKKSLTENNWYSIRLFDLYESFILKSESALLRFLFGTPFEGMRRVALERFSEEKPGFALPETFDWSPNPEFSQGKAAKFPVFDVTLGTCEGSRGMLKPDDLPLKLLRTLVSDFYAPVSEFELHEKLYPGEHHRGLPSTHRIHRLLQRLRDWLKENRIAIEVETIKRTYRVSPESKIRFRTLNPSQSPDSVATVSPAIRHAEAILRKAFKAGDYFSSPQIMKILDVSLRTSIYRLNELTQLGILVVEGSGRARRYRFTK